ncbi:MAG: MoaD/ThiS family protein [Synergistaceae bacterium]|jgi:molybdopterin converting factor small subunit|nr:MoaD/ThiS family protein [Synergistaceae bacterium]
MPITIQIPTALRVFTDRKSEVRANGATVAGAIADFAASYPDIRQHLYDEDGTLRSFINIYLGDTNVKNLGGLDTPLKDGDTLMLVPAIAGGSCPR